MIYLIVNNDFHVENLCNQMQCFEGEDLCVIRVPYNLNCTDSLARRNLEFKTPYKRFKDLINPLLFWRVKKEVRKLLFTPDDIVILLTEYDPINLYVAYLAKRSRAKVILLEEGIATYYNNIVNGVSTVSLANKCKLFYLKFLLGFHFIDTYKGNFLKLKDKYIDELIVYREINLERKINTSVVDSCSDKYIDLNEDKCIFLNQPLYQSFLEEDVYLEAITKVANSLSQQFVEVFFKYHPRDSEYIKTQLKLILNKYDNVTVISENYSLSDSINACKPKHAISFFSDALFKLSESGLNMIFLYHFFPELKTNSVLISLTNVLNEMSFQFSKEINNLTFVTNNRMKVTRKNLKSILKVEVK